MARMRVPSRLCHCAWWTALLVNFGFSLFVVAFVNHRHGHHHRPRTTGMARSPACVLPFQRTSLHFLSNNDQVSNNDVDADTDANANDDDAIEEELNFPNWIEGLRQWPLYPTMPSLVLQPLEELEQDEATSEGTESNFTLNRKPPSMPLADLVKIEGLLMAAGGAEMMEDDTKPSNNSFTNIGYTEDGASLTRETKQAFNWGLLTGSLQKSMSDLTAGSRPDISSTNANANAIGKISAETFLKEATSRIDMFVNDASTALSAATLQELITRASKLPLEKNVNTIVLAAEKLAQEQGLNVKEAADLARETTKSTINLVGLANGVLAVGYLSGDVTDTTRTNITDANGATVAGATRPLFYGFPTVSTISSPDDYQQAVVKAAEMSSLAAAIYEETIPRTHELGHSFVANRTTSDVVWMVTDSVGYNEDFYGGEGIHEGNGLDDTAGNITRTPVMVRTITIRGFDASDENVDREKVLNTICRATPTTLGKNEGIDFHAGLLSLAKDMYTDVIEYVDMAAPTHRIVLNGHSIGGALSNLILLLMVEDRGVEFVKEKIGRVFTFGSPPIAAMTESKSIEKPSSSYLGDIGKVRTSEIGPMHECDILKAFGLPSIIVYGYVQPWDPVVRLFTSEDPLYPLVDDIGDDGLTPYASGPPRTLRPITKSIFKAWDGWPRFRDNFASEAAQNYTSIGVQHLLLPDPTRYLSDRLVAVNVAVPPVETILRISSKELLPALKKTFPLDVFSISFVPAAIRSFVHHFYPAYSLPFVEYSMKGQADIPLDRPISAGMVEQQPSNDIEVSSDLM